MSGPRTFLSRVEIVLDPQDWPMSFMTPGTAAIISRLEGDVNLNGLDPFLTLLNAFILCIAVTDEPGVTHLVFPKEGPTAMLKFYANECPPLTRRRLKVEEGHDRLRVNDNIWVRALHPGERLIIGNIK